MKFVCKASNAEEIVISAEDIIGKASGDDIAVICHGWRYEECIYITLNSGTTNLINSENDLYSVKMRIVPYKEIAVYHEECTSFFSGEMTVENERLEVYDMDSREIATLYDYAQGYISCYKATCEKAS